MQATRTTRWRLPALCSAAGLAGLSISVAGPILVDIAHSYGISVALAGQLTTVASFSGMAGMLGLSPLVDRIGRREALLATLLELAAAALLCSVAPSFTILCIASGLLGLGGFGLVALVLAAVGDLYPAPQLGRAMGWVVAGNVTLVVVGLPMLAALSAWGGWRLSFVAYALLAALAAGAAYLALPAGLKAVQVHPGYLGAFAILTRNPALLPLLLTVGFYHSAVYGFGTYLGALAIQRFAVGATVAAPVLSLRYLGTAVAGLLAGRALRTTDWRVTVGAAVLLGLSSLAACLAYGGFWVFTFLALLQGIAIGVMDVALNSLLVSSEAAERGLVTALRSVMDSLGGVVGPALGGLAIAYGGYPTAGWLFGALALLAATSTALGAVRSRKPA